MPRGKRSKKIVGIKKYENDLKNIGIEDQEKQKQVLNTLIAYASIILKCNF